MSTRVTSHFRSRILNTPLFLALRVTRAWPSPVPQKSVHLASKWSRRSRQSIRGWRTGASCTAFIGRPCATTWSTSSTSWSDYPRSIWWTVSWRILPSCRWVRWSLSRSACAWLFHVCSLSGNFKQRHAGNTALHRICVWGFDVGAWCAAPHLPVDKGLANRNQQQHHRRTSNRQSVRPAADWHKYNC